MNVKCQTFLLVWEPVTYVELDNRHPYYGQLTAVKIIIDVTCF